MQSLFKIVSIATSFLFVCFKHKKTNFIVEKTLNTMLTP
jgi:hypothetical protein